MEQKNTWAILAALRFLFALIVAYSHIYYYSAHSFANLVRQFGSKSAVFGFFVISGYSIAHSIQSAPHGYYKRRCVRILPLYFAAVLFALVPFWVASLQSPPKLIFHFDLATWLGQWVFLQGVFVPSVPTNMPFWSISIEVFFYALAPYLVKVQARPLIAIAFASVTVCTVNNFLGIQSERYGFNIAQVAWAWLLGFLYYRANHHQGILILIAVMGTLVFETSHPYSPFASILWIGFCFALHKMRSGAVLSALEKRVMVYAGELSYPLYLFHFPVTMCILALVHHPAPELCVGAGLLMTVLAYHLIDAPFRKWARSKTYKLLPNPAMLP